MTAADILVVTDPRFAGGTTSAVLADVEAFLALGARVGLMCVHSAYLDDMGETPNPLIAELLDREGVEKVPADGTVRAGTVFLHHPMVFFHGTRERAGISADRTVLVTHHVPFRGDGSLEYDPMRTARRIWRDFRTKPLWAPISGLCRRQLASFQPLIRLTTEDWTNIFDAERWQPARAIFEGSELVIGRHGRVDPLKWPETAGKIDACLPGGRGRRIRVMGCPVEDLRALGTDMSGWEIVPFGAEPVDRFLDGLDVFSYFHHPRWVETFGRTVAEAALMGRFCVLDPGLEATFGDIAVYCQPAEVSALLDRMQAAPEDARALGDRARTLALARYGRDSIAGRLARLRVDPGQRMRIKPSVPVLRTARKLAGLYRRRAHGGPG